MSNGPAGRVALVVGGTGTVGAHVCTQLAASGVAVAVHFRSNERAARAIAAEIGSRAMTVQADLADATAVDELFRAVTDRFGPPDILVNTVHDAPSTIAVVADAAPEAFESHLRAAAVHARLCARAIPAMRSASWGRIVYVAGALMSRPHPGFAAYGAAKAAASVITRYVALEEGRNGITANIVAPGRIVDPDEPEDLEEGWSELAEQLLERTALGRFPTPAQVAAAIVSLAGPGTDAITGQTIWITGGEPIA